MKQTKYYCDIHECENEASLKAKGFQVIFVTEQTEGRSVKPYFSTETLDICDDCNAAILASGKYIQASGAQGCNRYQVTAVN